MGRVSEMWLEAEMRGWTDLDGKFVCPDCLYDYALANVAMTKASSFQCSYCAKTGQSIPIAADMNDVMPTIVEGLALEWGDPNNEGVAYVTREGGWLGQVLDSYELLDAIGFEAESADLVDDICLSLTNDQWCQRDYNRLLPQDELTFSWRDFSNALKYRIRYVFYRAAEPVTLVPPERPSHEILDNLGSFSKGFKLIHKIPVGTSLFRARIHSWRKKLSDIHDLGPPTAVQAKFSNRMSPAGIPMFYGSLDKKTAIQEVTRIRGENDFIDRIMRFFSWPKRVTSAEFKTTKEFLVLDLTKIPDCPSLFDVRRHGERAACIFLNEFVEDISRPIKKDGREHIEYVPTQVVTEYFRHIYRHTDDQKIMGIIFPSAVGPGVSVVLFVGPARREGQVVDENSVDTWLSIETDDIVSARLSRRNS